MIVESKAEAKNECMNECTPPLLVPRPTLRRLRKEGRKEGREKPHMQKKGRSHTHAAAAAPPARRPRSLMIVMGARSVEQYARACRRRTPGADFDPILPLGGSRLFHVISDALKTSNASKVCCPGGVRS